jgi:hypothetical protein
LKRGVEFFKQASLAEPNSAMTYAGLADAYVALCVYGAAVSPNEAMPHAIEAADRALGLDGRSAEALTALSCARALYDWDWEAGIVVTLIDFTRIRRNLISHREFHQRHRIPLERYFRRMPEPSESRSPDTEHRGNSNHQRAFTPGYLEMFSTAVRTTSP